MLRKAILVTAAVVSVAAVTVMLLGHQADRLVIGARSFDRVEVRVNSYTASAQSHIAIDVDDAGRVVAVWDSRRQDRGTYGVFARWIDDNGICRGLEEQVNLERRSMQMRPAVSVGEDGAVWFAWESFNQDGDRGSIIGRTDDDEHIANETTAGDQSDVAVDRLADDRLVAVWATSEPGYTETRIAMRLFDAGGAPLTRETVLDAPERCRDQLPAVAAAGENGFIVTWARVAPGGGASAVYAQCFDRDGQATTAAVRVNDSAAWSIEPSIAADRSGRFVVAWLERRNGEGYDVMVRRFAADGAPLGEVEGVCAEQAGWKSGAAVAMSSAGQYLVAWNADRDEDLDSDVYARLFGADGQPISDPFRVNRQTSGIQNLAAATGVRRIALADDGRMVFAWDGASEGDDESAVSVTLLIPVGSGPFGDLATGLRRGRALLAGLLPEQTVRLETAASPYIPPAFDETLQGPLLDPDSYVVGARGIGFTGFTSTGWTPPDPHMAAGTNHLMAIVNGGIAAYQKDGTLLWMDDISDSGGFWGEVGATWFVFDPEVIFDPYENRFIAMANERGSDNHSYFLLGISSTDDPTDPWYKYRLDVTALAGNDIDSPNIAVDAQAIYLTADFFTGGEKYLIYIIDKGSVIDGGTPVATSYLRVGSQSFGIPVQYTPDAPTMYMIEHFESEPVSTVRLWAIVDPLGTPSLTSFTLDVPAYYRPGRLRSLGTSVRPYTFDSRFWSCMYRDGSLWAAHHIAMTNSPRTTVARWYEIEMNGWPDSGNDPTLRQSGTVEPPNDVYCSFNSITADQYGNAVMVFARSSVDEYYSISRVFRYSSDPVGYMSPPEFVKQSEVAYTRDRWGDYSAVVADPNDLGTFWMHHEYAMGSNNWHTWIASEEVLDPAAVLPGPDRAGVRLRVSPSPTEGPATLAFELPHPSDVTVEIFDIQGRLVMRRELGGLGAGNHEMRWDGRDRGGTRVAGGVYLARVLADGRLVGNVRLTVAR